MRDTNIEQAPTFTLFAGAERIACGAASDVAVAAAALAAQSDSRPVHALDNSTGRPVDFDLRGTLEEIAARYAPPRRSAGRPKLGVVGREVTLLPRQWEWLNAQPGGASVALRRLVDAAKRESAGAELIRAARDAAYAAMTVLAGDEPGYEEAIRCLYAGDEEGFTALIAEWPADVAHYVRGLAVDAFGMLE